MHVEPVDLEVSTAAVMAGQKIYHEGGPKESARRIAASLTLEEQVSLLAGQDFWRTAAIPSRAIPSIKTTDGPNGARGALFTDGTPAALFPCGVSLAATWDVDLLRQVGEHLAEETKARGADVLLAPTVCLHRSPLGGRNFESFSEDPILTGKLAAAYINGLQSKGIAATIKHFVGNEQETNRMTVNSIIQERPLRELYLKPFEIAIREANPWALMTSYNRLNGVYADQNTHTVKDILRGEWNYDGLVMSDWTGTNSVAEAIAAGCDLEMPGPAKWRGERALKAVADGELSKEDVERAAANVIYLVQQTKGLDGPAETEERPDDVPERRELIRRLGSEGMTLLKNNGVLPLRDGEQTIALIGPNAGRAIVHGGGSASVKPYYSISPLEGLQATSASRIVYAQGCDTRKWLPLLTEAAECRSTFGKQGITLEYFRGDQFEGPAAHVVHRNGADLFLWDNAPKDVLPAYSFKARCTVVPATAGTHTFSFMSVGPARMYVNGQLFIDNWDWTEEGEAMFDGSVDVIKDIALAGGRPVEVVVESTNEIRPASKIRFDGPRHQYGGCRIGFREQETRDLLAEAVAAAAQADVAVVVVGLDAEWESEGYDRQIMDLPHGGSQDALIDAVARANPNTVVVNQSGTPVTMPWADDVAAIVQGWYQGQEAGHALADVLLGRADPSGRLPVTFPKVLQDNPAYHNWPGENLDVVYGEGLYVGYKHFDRLRLPPLFPFGHGLSYTRFEHGPARWLGQAPAVLPEHGRLALAVPVRNAGARPGTETVQVYVRDVRSRLPRPEKELRAFAKVRLGPGESKDVVVYLDRHAVGYYDTALSAWVAEEGAFEALVGASSADIRSVCEFEVAKTFTWIF